MNEYEIQTGYKRNTFYKDRFYLIKENRIRIISKGSKHYYVLVEDKNISKKKQSYSVQYKKRSGRKLMTEFFPPIENNTE